MTCNSGQHFAGNSELFPLLPAHGILAGNSFIVRCHVTISELANDWARWSFIPARVFDGKNLEAPTNAAQSGPENVTAYRQMWNIHVVYLSITKVWIAF